MTQEQIQEGNKIIAEFMGNSYVNRQLPPWAFRLYDFDTLGYGGYQYHKSFDWLIPVVKKIQLLEIEKFSEKKPIMSAIMDVDIEILWRSVVEFIKWYSKNNKS